VFVCENGGNVLSFDASNGKLLWEKDVGGYVTGGSTLAIYDGKLCFGSKCSIVYRLDPTTGRKEMEHAAPVSSGYRSKSAPNFFVADGKVFAEADGTLVYDTNTGGAFMGKSFIWKICSYCCYDQQIDFFESNQILLL